MLLGEVFDDSTGLPLAVARAELLSLDGAPSAAPVPAASSDGRGRFTLVSESGSARIRISKTGYTTVERTVLVVAGRVALPFDARLTPVDGNSLTIPASGDGTVMNEEGTVFLVIPPGALPADQSIQVTQVGAQGLIGRLPLGWSPAVTVDIQPQAYTLAQPASLTARVPAGLPASGTVIAVRWDAVNGRWLALGRAARSADGQYFQLDLAETGQYAFLLADQAPAIPPLPGEGMPLSSAPAVVLPSDLQAAISPSPRILFATSGNLSHVTINLLSASPLQSGTAIQIDGNESYRFTQGAPLYLDPITQDFTLYAFPGASSNLQAEFRVTPSHLFPLYLLQLGQIDLAAHLAPSGGTLKGSVVTNAGGTVTGSDGETVTIPSGAAAQPLAVWLDTLTPNQLPAILPNGLSFVGALWLDLGGSTLDQPATLSIPAPGGLGDQDVVLVFRMSEIDGRSRLSLVNMAVVRDGRLRTTSDPTATGDLPFGEVRAEGAYLFLKASAPTGFVTGTVTGANGSPLPGAAVTLDGMGILALAGADGRYAMAAPVGKVTLTATDPATQDTTAGTVTLTAGGEVAVLDLGLAPTAPRVRAVTPADGALNVSLLSTVSLTFSEPILAASVTSSSISLAGPGGPLAASLSMTPDGQSVTLRPLGLLQSQTTYTLTVSTSILDLSGRSLAAAFVSHFSTEDKTPPSPPPAGSLAATIPDASGFSTVTGTQGTSQPDWLVVIRNRRSGALTTVLPETDGSFSARVSALATDTLELILRDAAGNETLVPIPAFRDPDGRTVVGQAGGQVTGPGGVSVDIPSGALKDGSIVKVDPLPQSAFALAPPSGFEFVSGLNLDLGGALPASALDVGLSAPAGASASDQVIVAQVVSNTYHTGWMVMDRAYLVNGQYQTASPPFPGIPFGGQYAFLRSTGDNCVSYVSVRYDYSIYFWLQALPGGFAYIPPPHFNAKTGIVVLPAVCNQTLNITVSDNSTNVIIQSISQEAPGRDTIVTFNGYLTDDVTPPSITELEAPFNLGDNLYDVKLTFSEAMDRDSISTRNLTVTNGGNQIPGTVEVLYSNTVALFHADIPFHLGQEYEVKLESATDLAGNPLPDKPMHFTPAPPAYLSSIQQLYGETVGADDTVLIGHTLFVARRQPDDLSHRIMAVDVRDPSNPKELGFDVGILELTSIAGLPDADFEIDGVHFNGDLLVAVGGRADLDSKFKLYDVSACVRTPVPGDNCMATALMSTRYLTDPNAIRPPSTLIPREPGAPRAVTIMYEPAIQGIPATAIAYVATVPIGLQALDLSHSFSSNEPDRLFRNPLNLPERVLFSDVAVLKDKVLATGGPGDPSLWVFDAGLAPIGKIKLKQQQPCETPPPSTSRVAAAANLVFDVDGDGNLGDWEDQDQDSTTARDELYDVAVVSGGRSSCTYIVDLSPLTDLQSAPTHQGEAAEISRVPMPPAVTRAVLADPIAQLAYVELQGRGLALVDLGHLLRIIKDPRPYDWDVNHDGLDDRIIYIIDKPDINQPHGLAVDLADQVAYVNGSASLNIVGRALLAVQTPVRYTTRVDRINAQPCSKGQSIHFAISRPAEITITIEGHPLPDVVGRPFDPGGYDIPLPYSVTRSPGTYDFEVTAEFIPGNPVGTVKMAGVILHELVIEAAFPVGHTMVDGVDLADGHLTLSSQDVVIPGRGLSLDFSRTYSSAGIRSSGPMGAGWTHSYNIRLVVDGCDRYIVEGGEGSGNAFTGPPVADGSKADDLGLDRGTVFYKPQIGYHSNLVQAPGQSKEFDFYTKSHVRYHFVLEPAIRPEETYTLRTIEDPNGNQITLDYDDDGDPTTLDSVTDSSGRSLVFDYQVVAFEKRIVSLKGHSPGTASDLFGLLIKYDYDALGNLIQVIRTGSDTPDRRVEQYAYSVNDQLDPQNMIVYNDPNYTPTAPNGHQTIYEYESVVINELPYYLVTKIEARNGPDPVITRFVYNFVDNTRTVTDPRNPAWTTTYTLNNYKATTKIVEPLSKETNMEWCTDTPSPSCPKANGDPGVDALMTSMTDAMGRKYLYEYGDKLGNLTKETIQFASDKPVTLVDGTGERTPVYNVETIYTYDYCTSKMTSKIDTKNVGQTTTGGNKTTYDFEKCTGNLKVVTDAENQRTDYAYYDNGDLLSITDPRGVKTTYEYDVYGNPTKIRNIQGNVTNNVTTNRYDARSRLVESFDTFGHHTVYTYDSLDRKICEERLDNRPSGTSQKTIYQYLPHGELALQTDGLGHSTRYSYDGLNRRIAQDEIGLVKYATGVNQPAIYNLRATYEYDKAGNLVTETDLGGIVHKHTCDALNRRIQTAVGGQVIFAATYDLAGNKLTETDLHGYTTKYTYDGLYRVVETHLPFQGVIVKTDYDLVGNKLQETDANGQAALFEYDKVYRLIKRTDADGNAVEYGYDASGNKVREANLSSGLVTEYEYDGLNRVTLMTQTVPLGGPGLATAIYTTRYEYDDGRNAVTVTDPRGIKTRTDKDGLDRTYQTTVDVGGLELTQTFTYDGNGNVRSVSDAQDGNTDVINEYDGLNRKIRVVYAGAPGDGVLPGVGGVPKEGDRAVTEEFAYDGNGNLVRQKDKNGIEFTWTYDNLNRELTKSVKEILTNGGAELRMSQTYYEYPGCAIGLYCTATYDANGNRTVTSYDALNRPTIIDDPDDSGLTVFEFDGVNKRSETDKRGMRTEYDYDAINRLVETRELDLNGALRTTLSTEYQDSQNVTLETDRRGVRSIHQNDALGRLVKLRRAGLDMATTYGAALVVLETHEYDGNNNPVAFVDGQGNRTETVYDAAGRKIRSTEGIGTPVAATTSWTYDLAGNVLTVKDGRNHGGAYDWQYTYDPRYRQVSATNGEGETTSYLYDANNNLIQVSEPNGTAFRTRYVYDELNQLLAVDETPRANSATPAGVTRFFYDANRNKIAQQDANGNLVTYQYDGLNRLTATFQHTAAGSLTDKTQRGSDPRGSGLRPGGNEATALHWRYGYDLNGNQALIVDALGQRVEMAYDYLDRLTSKTYSAYAQPSLDFQPLSIAYAYDPNGNVSAITETKKLAGATITETEAFSYDPLDRLRVSTRHDYDDPAGKPITYEYDIQGNRTQVTDADGVATAYTYDARNRLDTVTSAAGVTRYTWWPDGLLATVLYPNGTWQYRGAADSYDRADRVRHISNGPLGPAAPYSSYDYSYDRNGNRASQIETQKALGSGQPVTTTYTYDNLNRLASVSYGTSGAIAYTYAANGNRLREAGVDPRDGQPVDRSYLYQALADRPGVTYDRVNALTRIVDNRDAGQTITYEYDANLNQTAREQAGARAVYRFGVRDQMLAASAGGALTAYDYNADGLRTKKVEAGAETRYLYDDQAVLAEYRGVADGLRTLSKYDYGYELLALTEVDAAGQRAPKFYLTDALMSTANLADAAGALAQSYRYDAWGRVLAQAGGSSNPRQYTGHYYDAETGLSYFGARYYDPEIGRFLSQDPYLGEVNTPPSLHRYLYAYANPLRWVDLTGYNSVSASDDEKEYVSSEEDANLKDEAPLTAYETLKKNVDNPEYISQEEAGNLREAALLEKKLEKKVVASQVQVLLNWVYTIAESRESVGKAEKIGELGSLSEEYESSKRGPGTVSPGKGDYGGPSYGVYSLTSRNGGRVLEFLKNEGETWAGEFKKLTPGTEAFTKKWKEIAEREPDEFRKAQHKYIKRTHYDPLVKKVNKDVGMDVSNRSRTLQDVIWSTAVQHGPSNEIVKRALKGRASDTMSDSEIIEAIYAERGKRDAGGNLHYFSKNSKKQQKGVAERFTSEMSRALKQLHQEENSATSQSFLEKDRAIQRVLEWNSNWK